MRQAALLFFNFSRRSPFGSFGRYLDIAPVELGGTVEIQEIGPTKSVVTTRVPSWCVDSSGALLLSGAIAQMDEISTYCGTLLWDRYLRPGLSLQLTARRIRSLSHVRAGDKLIFETRLQKIGKTIGFVDVVIRDVNSEPIIFGQHIKFMPINPIFKAVFHPYVRSSRTISLCHKLLNATMPLPPLPRRVRLEEMFPLSDPVLLNDNTLRYASNISVIHGNPIGSFHGGASVMLSHYTALQTLEQINGRSQSPMSIKTTLLNAVPVATKARDVTIDTELWWDRNFNFHDFHTTRSIISFRGSPAIDCTIKWS